MEHLLQGLHGVDAPVAAHMWLTVRTIMLWPIEQHTIPIHDMLCAWEAERGRFGPRQWIAALDELYMT